MNDKDNKQLSEQEWWDEYYKSRHAEYKPYEPPKQNVGWLANFFLMAIPIVLISFGLVSLRQCESNFKASEKNKMLEQDIKYRSCVDVRAIDRAATDPQAYHESIVGETKAQTAPTTETKAESKPDEMVWSDHNGDYMKCRKDFVKYLKYSQRYITNPQHDPMYVSAEIKGDVLCLISYSFKQLPSNRDAVWNEYERMILDCNFREVRMCPLVSTRFYLYWKDGEKYEYWK